MAASTSFSSAAALGSCCSSSRSRFCHYASKADCAHVPSPLSSSSFRAGGNFRSFGLVLRPISSRSSSSSSQSPRLRPRCNSVSEDDAPASSSSTTTPSPSPPPPPPPTAQSGPLESSSSSSSSPEGEEGSAQLPPREQQRRRPQRREAGSTDWISSSLSRRFGLAGGLAWVGFLAFGVISEQIKTRTEVYLESQGTQDVEGSAKEVVLDNNVKYVDLRTGGGSSPFKGDLVLVELTGKVRSTGEVFLDATSRPLAFVFGLKPYANGVCYGLEYALQSMKAGGKRRVTVPADQCFGDAGEDLGHGVVVPGGADVEYEVQLQRVSIAPS